MLNKIKSAVSNTRKSLQRIDTIKVLQAQSKTKAEKRVGKTKPSNFAPVRIKHPKMEKASDLVKTTSEEPIIEEVVCNENTNDMQEEIIKTTQYTKDKSDSLLASTFFGGISEGMLLGILAIVFYGIINNAHNLFMSCTLLVAMVFFYIILRLFFGAVIKTIAAGLKLPKKSRIKSYQMIFSSTLSAFWASKFALNILLNNHNVFNTIVNTLRSYSIFGVLMFLLADFCIVYWKEILKKVLPDEE